MITLDSIPHIADPVRHRRVGDEGVIVRQDAAEVTVVNEIGARILELIDGRSTVAGLIAALESEYDAARAQIEDDVLRFLSEMQQSGIISDSAHG